LVSIGSADPSEQEDIEQLIAAYHSSEGIRPIKERIRWTVNQHLQDNFPGILLVARNKGTILGVTLAVYTPSAELGRVMTVNDFFVTPDHRRKGVGRQLVKRLIEECRLMKIDEIGLEVLHENKTAAAFWKSVGFQQAERFLYRKKLKN
jgi:GNAT superfamily N-acetyltransferase